MADVAQNKWPSSAFTVAYVLSGYVNSKSRIAWPSQAKMAALTGLEEGTVQKQVGQLRRAGFLTIRRVSRKSTNRYGLARPSKSRNNAKTAPA